MLSGIKIVEICGIGPGPFCAMHLADLGADVIAVEREAAPGAPSTLLNRGKRSVVADLKTAEGRELVLQLVDEADALVEGMRPGVMERLGLGPEVCAARNPRLVYGRMTGWGQNGPLAQAAGHDNNYIATSGALYYSGTPAEPPQSAITLVGDVGGGALYLAVGLLAGILKARSTGKGTVVDASIVDGSAHMMQLLLATRQKGLVTGGRGENVHDSSHFFATYRCADGHFITLGSLEPQFYALLLEKLGLQGDPRFTQQWERSRWPELHAHFTELFASRTRDAWSALLEGTDVCFGPVLSPTEAAQHPHNVARGIYFERDGLLQSRPAPRFDGEVVTPGALPQRGAHTAQILAALQGEAPASVWQQN
ncbi:E-cinnamoyl-CoA:R-phenyllactate CoA transferase [compost metagenome]|uniref:CaiB/BaiF CoA transferase family protein n=1 Tax=Variovorax boronicumulans TaxID=436515 RepID=UPI000BB37282|nr:CaiB/BaiF CoA-transferase family protein [Variovorax boronicumulans]PBI95766.1 E-cinnamoyl-CoA:R-phenyllactate CoA transferase [Variovorax boronicumulans]